LNSFVGYDSLEIKTKVVKYRKVKAKGKESFHIVLEATPFYAESGGQVGDTGYLEFNGKTVRVTDTKKENDLTIHFVGQLPSDLNGYVVAKVEMERRENIALHHTATHLLHAALRKILGVHVTQKGSLVNNEHLRFDFSHFAKMSDEEIARVNAMVNEMIRKNISVITKEMPKDEALALGALALFGEKYGDVVRVVIIDPKYSIELCGGTHAGFTGELGYFRITHETAVAAGVRRVEAVCGKMAETFVDEQLGLMKSIQESLKNPKELKKAVDNILNENAELKKKLENFETRQLEDLKNVLVKKAEAINGSVFIGKIVEVNNPDALRKLCFDLKNETPNSTIVLAANIESKAYVAILLDEKLAAEKNLDASRIIKEEIAPLIKGGGGGQKTLATAGGQDTTKLEQVIQKVRSLL
jgi:alanyl-tRNA synthetase